MKPTLLRSLLITSLVTALPIQAASIDLSNTDQTSISNAINSALEQVQGNTELTNDLSNQLNVSPMQAAGGAGALLALAQNNLGQNENEQLGEILPGVDQLTSLNLSGTSNLLSSVNSLSDVNRTFSELGLDTEMLGQYAPLLLEYLKQHKADQELLTSLSALWGVK